MPKQSKLPVAQLAILSLCRVAEPIAYTSVLPYLPEMIEGFGVPKDDIGKWAGICGSVFSLSQCLTAILWGRASDRFGRKSTILVGLTLTMFTNLMFGFSKTLGAAITVRALAGLGNGNGGILRTMAAEMISDKALQPRVFSIMPLMWNVGSFAGPMIGGGLADPVHKYPRIFGKIALFEEFPYALPNLTNCLLFVIGIVAGFLFLHETLAAKRNKLDYGIELGKALTSHCVGRKSGCKTIRDEEERLLQRDSLDSSDSNTSKVHLDAMPFSWKAVFGSQARVNLLECLMLGMHSVAFDQLLPVYMHHPRSEKVQSTTNILHFSGGFGLDSGHIGFLLMLNGLFGMFVQFVIFPPVANRFGVLKCLKVCTILFAVIYILFPFTSLIASGPLQQAVALVLIVGKSCLTVFAFPSNAILLTNSSTSANTLGTLNGVATSVAAIGRTVGPLLGGIMFSVGIDAGYMVLPWWSIATIAVLAAMPVFWMEDMPALNAIVVEVESDADADSDANQDDAEGADLQNSKQYLRNNAGTTV